MGCTNPRAALLIPDSSSSTGRKIKFLPARYIDQDYAALKAKYGDMFVDIPCGKCDACIEVKTKSWAVRCSLEAGQYEKNCFITLTYNNYSVPKDGVCKKHVFKFIKDLRNHFGAGIRYYGCAEYGSKFDRPHYHAILFNFFPADAKPVHYDPITGCIYYLSKSLQHIWKYGFVSIGEVTFNSCAYVARYCQKKIKEVGIARKNPEFSFMSRKPGIGENYFREHFDSLMATDQIYSHIGDKFKFSSFRYFDKLIERVDPDRLQELKNQRIRSGVFSVSSELLRLNIDNMGDYLIRQEKLIGEKYNRLNRRLS